MLFIMRLLFGLLFTMGTAWAFMIGVGIAHHEWVPNLPTVGYKASFMIMLMVSIVIDLIKVESKLED